jgi:hypothetical protein
MLHFPIIYCSGANRHDPFSMSRYPSSFSVNQPWPIQATDHFNSFTQANVSMSLAFVEYCHQQLDVNVMHYLMMNSSFTL